jgi:hypothetical protein
MSPDGMYYWDGASWVSTVSPDGRFRWDGATWTPVTGYALMGHQAPRLLREPTSWTRPLQYAVIGWYVWSVVYTLATPFWIGGMMSQLMSQSFERQQQVNPQASPPPPGFMDIMSTLVTFGLWITVVVYVAVFAVVIVGAWKRWTWIYWVVLVLLGLTTLLLPVDLFYVFAGPSMAAASGFTMPGGLYLVSFLTGIPAAAVFAFMLVALIKRGPWAMRRVS